MSRFGSNVRDERERQRLTQEELAFRCDVSQAYLSGIESGQRNPSLLNIIRIAQGLKVGIESLFQSPTK